MKSGAWMTLALLVGLTWGGSSSAAERMATDLNERELQPGSLAAPLEQSRLMRLLHHSDVTLYLNSLIDRLWTNALSDRPKVKVFVVQDAFADARTYRNGVIYLTTGILANMQSEDQLAMILAHEIIHYTQRHALAALNHLESDPAQGVLESDPAQGVSAALDAAELQADRQGLVLMHASGYCPQAFVSLMAPLYEKARNRTVPTLRKDVFQARLKRVQSLLEQLSAKADCPSRSERDQDFALHIAPVFLANAQSAVRQGLWEQAADSIQRYRALRADDPQGPYVQGEIEYRSGKHTDLAMAYYQRAIELDHAYAPAYRALGFMHFKAGHLQQARTFLESSLRLAPQADENDYIREYLQLCGE